MAETLNLGNGNWATKKESLLAYNDENNNFKPLPFNFTRNSSATRVNKEGLIEVVSNNEPRIDFKDNTKGALLLEPSRSNRFSNTDLNEWSKSGSVSLSETISPSGKNDAYEFGGTGNINLFTSLTSTGTYIFSIYAKGNVGDSFRVYKSNGFSYAQNTIIIDTTEWKRYYFTRDFSSTNGIIFIDSFGDDNISLYAPQLEQGSYATSYIPTSGSAVTRVAEQGINGGAGVPIFSNTSAVWFIDLERNGVDTDSSGSAIALRNSSFSQQIRLHFDQPATNIRFRDGLNGFATISTIIGMSAGVRKKIALRINGSALSTFANGSKIGSDYTAPSTFNIDEIDFATLGFKIHDMRFYNEILTDQELINLTTI